MNPRAFITGRTFRRRTRIRNCRPSKRYSRRTRLLFTTQGRVGGQCRHLAPAGAAVDGVFTDSVHFSTVDNS